MIKLPQFLNKKISTPVGTGILVLCAVLVGGVLVWQMGITPLFLLTGLRKSLTSSQQRVSTSVEPTTVPEEEKEILLPEESDYEEIISLAKGDEPGEVGIKPGGFEVLPLGPEAIGVGPDGTIYVLDTLNRRIQGFDAGGRLTSVVEISSAVYATDLRLDSDRNFYVLSELGAGKRGVLKFDHQGNLVGTFEAAREIRGGVSGMAVDKNGNVLWQVSRGTEYKLSSQGRALSDEEQIEGKIEGKVSGLTLSGSDRRWHFNRISRKSGILKLYDATGATENEIRIDVPHELGSISLLDIDQEGNSYLLVEELLEGPRIIVETTMRKYTPEGKFQGIARLPIGYNERYFLPQRFATVDQNGNLYHLLVLEDSAKILRVKFLKDFKSQLENNE